MTDTVEIRHRDTEARHVGLPAGQGLDLEVGRSGAREGVGEALGGAAADFPDRPSAGNRGLVRHEAPMTDTVEIRHRDTEARIQCAGSPPQRYSVPATRQETGSAPPSAMRASVSRGRRGGRRAAAPARAPAQHRPARLTPIPGSAVSR
jgi:hypothetical protein